MEICKDYYQQLKIILKNRSQKNSYQEEIIKKLSATYSHKHKKEELNQSSSARQNLHVTINSVTLKFSTSIFKELDLSPLTFSSFFFLVGRGFAPL